MSPVDTFSKAVNDRYFEDYIPGSTHECGSVDVEEDEIVAFAKKFDPQPFHVDPEAAADGPFGGLIASGWHTTALVMRLFVEHYLSGRASLGSPGVEELRWLRPVRPGDVLRLRAKVIDAERSPTRPNRGLVRTQAEMINQKDEIVLSMKVLNFLRVRDAEA